MRWHILIQVCYSGANYATNLHLATLEINKILYETIVISTWRQSASGSDEELIQVVHRHGAEPRQFWCCSRTPAWLPRSRLFYRDGVNGGTKVGALLCTTPTPTILWKVYFACENTNMCACVAGYSLGMTLHWLELMINQSFSNCLFRWAWLHPFSISTRSAPYRREESRIEPTIITFVCQGLLTCTELKKKIENVILLRVFWQISHRYIGPWNCLKSV